MNKIFIKKNAILNNINILQNFKPEQEIFPVVKSNAYGHGLEQICKILNETTVKYICVDSFPEYQIVKDTTKKNILLIGETRNQNYKYFDFQRTTFCIHNIEAIHTLGKLSKKNNKKTKIHLFINTGMNREWLQYTDLINILETIKDYPNIEIEGVLSHFYDVDNLANNNYLKQIEAFKEYYYEIINYGHSPKYRHISASAGFFRNEDTFFNAARVGLSTYGYSPFTDNASEKNIPAIKQLSETAKTTLNNLQPALIITSQLISKQSLWKQAGVSYNHTFITTDETILTGTIPFWYMEGIPRSASNAIYFKNNKNNKLPQIWTVCMNLSSCRLTLPDHTKLYTPITLIDEDYDIKNRSKASNLSIYEILVKLDRNIRREIL